HRMNVMKRMVRSSGVIPSALVARFVAVRVPAPEGQVETADKSELSVNDDDLLVMRSRKGMSAVGHETDPRMAKCLRKRGKDLPFKDVEKRGIPAKDIDLEPGIALDSAKHRVSERDPVTHQVGARIDVPGQDHHRLAGLIERPEKELVIFL